MKVIQTRNVHQALPEALYQLRKDAVPRASRNGPVRVFQEPVTTVYERPCERVLFWPSRDCNPFFHLYESLWMLAGRNDVESLARYVERMRTFSDDGLTFHGAYGFRWREWFGFDQLPRIIAALKADPTDRRQVLSMWDATQDLGRVGKDLPCNLQALFFITDDGALDMSVTNRSNDIVWGAYGANAVHFSYLQEYVAAAIERPVGKYRQVSFNFHGYEATIAQVEDLVDLAPDPVLPSELRWAGLCPYTDGVVEPFPLVSTPIENWDGDLQKFIDGGVGDCFADPFFACVAEPMREAHDIYKSGTGEARYTETLAMLDVVVASDWRLASQEWVRRRWAKYEEKQQGAAA